MSLLQKDAFSQAKRIGFFGNFAIYIFVSKKKPKVLKKNPASTAPFTAIYRTAKDLRIAGSLLDKYEKRNIILFLYDVWLSLRALPAKETDVLRTFPSSMLSHLFHLVMQQVAQKFRNLLLLINKRRPLYKIKSSTAILGTGRTRENV